MCVCSGGGCYFYSLIIFLYRLFVGPVLPIMRMDSVEAAVAHCNASKLALQGSVFSQNIDRAISISDAMETGTVQVAQIVCLSSSFKKCLFSFS